MSSKVYDDVTDFEVADLSKIQKSKYFENKTFLFTHSL